MAHERILVVEDESITAMDICERIRALGYEPLGPVASGRDAIESSCVLCPDLVLMDIILRGPMDGVQAAEVIQSMHPCPVVYVTAHSDRTTLDRAKLTAPYGYILKPVSERELHVAIEIALHRHRMEKQLMESKEWFRVTLRSIDEAIIALDTSGRVTFINPAAQTLLGWPEADALGTGALAVFNVISEEPASPGGIALERGDKYVSILTKEKKTVSVVYRAASIAIGTDPAMGTVIIFRETPSGRKPRSSGGNGRRR
jgi:AmiR/NasT family two-component response regulator